MSNLNVGVIGLGVGEQHIIGFLKSNNVKSVSIFFFDKDKKKLMKYKKVSFKKYTQTILK